MHGCTYYSGINLYALAYLKNYERLWPELWVWLTHVSAPPLVWILDPAASTEAQKRLIHVTHNCEFVPLNW